MKMYKVEKSTYSDPEINEVEVDRRTESSVWINGTQWRITSKHTRFFNTWFEAWDFLHGYLCDQEAAQELRLNKTRRRIDQCRDLTDPDGNRPQFQNHDPINDSDDPRSMGLNNG